MLPICPFKRIFHLLKSQNVVRAAFLWLAGTEKKTDGTTPEIKERWMTSFTLFSWRYFIGSTAPRNEALSWRSMNLQTCHFVRLSMRDWKILARYTVLYQRAETVICCTNAAVVSRRLVENKVDAIFQQTRVLLNLEERSSFESANAEKWLCFRFLPLYISYISYDVVITWGELSCEPEGPFSGTIPSGLVFGLRKG